MYGRAPRSLTIAATGTTDAVGPGAYWSGDHGLNNRKAGRPMIVNVKSCNGVVLCYL